MRTTIAIDDEVLAQVREWAEERSLTLGKAATELLRRGLTGPLGTHLEGRIHVFTVPPGSPPITTEQVRKLEDELY